MKYVLLLSLLFFSKSSFSWGGRGHHLICLSAAEQVQNPKLKEFMRNRAHVMAHLCNIPDTSWRSLPKPENDAGAHGHYLNAEILGIAIEDVPTDLEQIRKEFKDNAVEKKPIVSLETELGTIWWRLNQFQKRAVTAAQTLNIIDTTGKTGDESVFNQAVYNFYTSLAMMGHFAGDISQPLHNTSDYDGYQKGHGGIHSYYEDAVVNELELNFVQDINNEARNIMKLQKKPAFLDYRLSVPERAKAFSAISYSELSEIYKYDKVLEPSEFKKDERGVVTKKAAKRAPAKTVVAQYRKLIATEMARSALFLAALWDESYAEAVKTTDGKFNIESYRSYKFPFQPDFIAPDYLANLNITRR